MEFNDCGLFIVWCFLIAVVVVLVAVGVFHRVTLNMSDVVYVNMWYNVTISKNDTCNAQIEHDILSKPNFG